MLPLGLCAHSNRPEGLGYNQSTMLGLPKRYLMFAVLGLLALALSPCTPTPPPAPQPTAPAPQPPQPVNEIAGLLLSVENAQIQSGRVTLVLTLSLSADWHPAAAGKDVSLTTARLLRGDGGECPLDSARKETLPAEPPLRASLNLAFSCADPIPDVFSLMADLTLLNVEITSPLTLNPENPQESPRFSLAGIPYALQEIRFPEALPARVSLDMRPEGDLRTRTALMVHQVTAWQVLTSGKVPLDLQRTPGYYGDQTLTITTTLEGEITLQLDWLLDITFLGFRLPVAPALS